MPARFHWDVTSEQKAQQGDAVRELRASAAWRQQIKKKIKLNWRDKCKH